MNIGRIVYFVSGNKVKHGKLVAIDGDPKDPSGYVVVNGQSVHWLMQSDIYAGPVEAGLSLLARLKRSRTDALKRAHEEAETVAKLDEEITEAIRAFK